MPPSRSADPALTASAIDLTLDLKDKRRTLAEGKAGVYSFTVLRGRRAIWLQACRAGGKGGFALRLCPLGFGARVRRKRRGSDLLRLEVETPIGLWRTSVAIEDGAVPVIRTRLSLTPNCSLVPPWLGRDLLVLGEDGDPASSEGRVEAAQRGVNGGLVYLRIAAPAFGSVLYFQDLTALNRYFRTTGTTPDGAVGGTWPELGYLPPLPDMKAPLTDHVLPPGEEMVISRALIALHGDAQGEEEDQARRYLQLLGAIYPHLERPSPEFRDWPERAARTWRDLDRSPLATVSHYGARYARPYTDAEYPDAMVQLTLLAAMRDWQVWSDEKPAPYDAFRKGLAKFHDRKLQVLRRYLPNVGKDKNANAVDSWYMYHPQLNLARLAQDGDGPAKRMLFDALEGGIKAARHFSYKWPIQFDVRDYSIITASRDDDGHGQTDVGGIYAYLMVQAFELSGEDRFIEEAAAALEAARGSRFELNYQANLTAWGAAACLRMWRITGRRSYLDQSYIFFASFFHNVALWESEIAHAREYRNFLGATALHDAPYMALFECFDSFAAFEICLKQSGPQLEPAVRLLLAEYCKYALDRAWFYYPDALPPKVLAEEQRNGHIACDLSFPLEDLYVDGQPSGQVGQEIYGAGAAAVFATRSFHRLDGVPFVIFADYPVLAIDRPSPTALVLKLAGSPDGDVLLALCPRGRARLPRTAVSAEGRPLTRRLRDGRHEFTLAGGAQVEVTW
jgi:hypothetical protein